MAALQDLGMLELMVDLYGRDVYMVDDVQMEWTSLVLKIFKSPHMEAAEYY